MVSDKKIEEAIALIKCGVNAEKAAIAIGLTKNILEYRLKKKGLRPVDLKPKFKRFKESAQTTKTLIDAVELACMGATPSLLFELTGYTVTQISKRVKLILSNYSEGLMHF